ncbi:MAG: 50S ribosomal protein L1 [Candidatus Syntropharchaeia archaeon]
MSVVDAVKEALKSPERKFDETVDLCINLRNIDMRQPQNRINEDIVLPNSFRKAKVCAFASGEMGIKAKEFGAHVISPEEIPKLDKKKGRELAKKYDFFVAEAQLMPQIGKILGPILGPRGKMPDPVPPQADITQIMERLRKTVRVRAKEKTFHLPVGKKSMEPEKIAENIETVIKKIESRVDKSNIDSVYVKTTMGSAVRVE